MPVSAFDADDARRAVPGGLLVGFALIFAHAGDEELSAAPGFAFYEAAAAVFMGNPPAVRSRLYAGIAADAFVTLKKDADQNGFRYVGGRCRDGETGP